jgi:hypothetical protein
MTDYASQLEDNATREDEQICDECLHPISLHHADYGCEYERGDAWITGNQPSQPTVLMAMGPCGCRAVTFESGSASGKGDR